MTLKTSLAGRVRNTSLPKSQALLPLLEAVVNSVQAIDARPGETDDPGHIQVQVHREGQEEFDLGASGPGPAPTKPVVGFTVTDNGVGFTADNMSSFETLDSDYKAHLGCRGVGRLLWLKAFEQVLVRSSYHDDDGTLQHRQFTFSVDREAQQSSADATFEAPGSEVHLDGFKQPTVSMHQKVWKPSPEKSSSTASGIS